MRPDKTRWKGGEEPRKEVDRYPVDVAGLGVVGRHAEDVLEVREGLVDVILVVEA